MAKFVSEEFAQKWYSLGNKYRNDNIKDAATKAGLEEYSEYNRWEACAAFEAAKEGFPFEIKTWMRFGDIPAGEDGFAGQSQKKIIGSKIIFERGVSVADKFWTAKLNNYLFPNYSTPHELFQNLFSIAGLLYRPVVNFPGLQVGYGHDGEAVVLPVELKNNTLM